MGGAVQIEPWNNGFNPLLVMVFWTVKLDCVRLPPKSEFMQLSLHLDRISQLVGDLAAAEDDDVRTATHYLLVHEAALVTRALGRLDGVDHAMSAAQGRLAEQERRLAGAQAEPALGRRAVANLGWAIEQLADLRRMWGARLAQGETLWDLEERTCAGRSASDALLRVLNKD
jgi:hypothetical protein